MKLKLIILLGMIFLHIIDDYVLQSHCLSNLKQRDWWVENTDGDDIPKIYKDDYKMGLFMHSLSWTISIMILPLFYIPFTRWSEITLFLIIFGMNIYIHYNIDNMKANKKEINLVFDQCIHLFQVVATWLIFVFPCYNGVTLV